MQTTETKEGKIKSMYQENQRIYVDDKESEGISKALTFFAWLTFIGGFIGGILIANKKRVVEGWYYDDVEKYFDWQTAVTVWLSCLLTGVVLLGLAKVIDLLSMTLSQNRLIYQSMSSLECYVNSLETTDKKIQADVDRLVNNMDNTVEKQE